MPADWRTAGPGGGGLHDLQQGQVPQFRGPAHTGLHDLQGGGSGSAQYSNWRTAGPGPSSAHDLQQGQANQPRTAAHSGLHDLQGGGSGQGNARAPTGARPPEGAPGITSLVQPGALCSIGALGGMCPSPQRAIDCRHMQVPD
eukprot:CAMPEP_0113934286 /NCGR_PEP_ID=MMETSP1339-20121228/1630_1 /TAXON_ID=94617 /ORGANISM="Fibrocapsa japonica" /LENGTH=142 /DNA_ID=CAMNT_0000936019 /DNA_START=121 /DNA_END=550 /DNA_ORIENTATION=+ /assembly_acc=CAM_ASM_000762